MKKKELKNLAKRLAEAELTLHITDDQEKVKKAKEEMFKIGYQLSSYEDMMYVDELVQEILSKVQNMRKDKGFEVLDKINLYVSENEMLEELVKKFESEIKKETLTENIVFNAKRDTYTEVNINGEKLMLDVEVVK